MFKIKTLNNIAEVGLAPLRDRGYTITDADGDAVIVRSADMHSMEFNPELLSIARAGAGVNNIPTDRCVDEGIVVFNTPGANAEAVKELTICALLLSSRDVFGGMEWVQGVKGQSGVAAQVETEKAKFTGPEIKGKTLGVLGLGATGALVANAAVGLGMKVLGYDPYLSVSAAWRLSAEIVSADLDTVYKNCDYISIHVPYMPATRHMIDATAIAKMRDGVRIINCARAELVNDEDILAALSAGKVFRYVTDFPNDVTAGAPGVIGLPHLGASTPESEDNCASMAADQTIEYLENGNIINSVNFPNLTLNRSGECRLCVLSKVALTDKLTAILEADGYGIVKMAEADRDGAAYTIIDLDKKFDGEEAVAALDGVLRVRVI